jgi:hypothetical protein
MIQEKQTLDAFRRTGFQSVSRRSLGASGIMDESTRGRFVLLTVRMFARRANFFS